MSKEENWDDQYIKLLTELNNDVKWIKSNQNKDRDENQREHEKILVETTLIIHGYNELDKKVTSNEDRGNDTRKIVNAVIGIVGVVVTAFIVTYVVGK